MPSPLETGPDLMHTASMGNGPPNIDHCVLPVGDLAVARERLTALGFTVAPEGRHPFGTTNSCIYFQDGSFVESLAVGDEGKWNATAIKGNVFVARDRAFRFRRGENGFSALALSTGNAAADQARFKAAGISAGPMLRFTRAARDREGKRDRASFRLAFAADLRSPDAYFFTCERVHLPSIDMDALRHHPNGVVAIGSVIASEPQPSRFADFLSGLTGTKRICVRDGGIQVALGKSDLSVLDNDSLMREFGLAGGHGRGLRLRAIVFRTADIERTGSAFEDAGIETRILGERLVVDAAPGQGAAFAFEERHEQTGF
jgi:hypothetical protein